MEVQSIELCQSFKCTLKHICAVTAIYSTGIDYPQPCISIQPRYEVHTQVRHNLILHYKGLIHFGPSNTLECLSVLYTTCKCLISFTCSIIPSGEMNVKRKIYWTFTIRLIYNSTHLHHTHIFLYSEYGLFQTHHSL